MNPWEMEWDTNTDQVATVKAPWEMDWEEEEGAKQEVVQPSVDERAEAMKRALAMPSTTDKERAARDQAIRDASRIGKTVQSASTTGGDQKTSDFIKGVQSTARGMYDLGLSGLDVITRTPMGVIPDYLLDKFGTTVEELKQENFEAIQQLNDSIKDKDFFSAGTMGKVLPTLATLPVSYQSKAAAFVLEGAMGYSYSRGEGLDELASLGTGLLAGALGAGTVRIAEGFTGAIALKEVKKEFPGVDENYVYSNFAKFIGKDVDELTNHDKVVAYLAQGKEKGAAYLAMAAKNDMKIKRMIDNLSLSQEQAVKEGLAQFNVARVVRPIIQQQAFASKSYNELKEIAKAYPTQPVNLGSARDDIIEALTNIPDIKRSPAVNSTIAKLSSREPVSISDLFDFREALSGTTIKAKRVDSKTREAIEGTRLIDSIIEANLPNEFSGLWRNLKDELALAYATKGANAKSKMNNVFGTLLSNVRSGEETYSHILEKLAKASGGPDKLNQILKAVGTDKAKEFELGLIKEIYSSKGMHLGETLERMKHIGFITPEGRNMQKQLRQLDEAFSSFDYYKVIADALAGSNIEGTSITANLISKFKYATMANVWDYIKPYVPIITKDADFLRHTRRVMSSIGKADIPSIKGLSPEAVNMYKGFQGVVRESIESTIRKELDYLNELKNAKIETQVPETPMLPNAPDFTATSQGVVARGSGTEAAERAVREPIPTTVVDEVPNTTPARYVPDDIIDVEIIPSAKQVITKDGHIIDLEDLIKAESLPDSSRLPEKIAAPLKHFFDMRLKLKEDKSLINLRNEVKKAKTPEAKSKAKDRLSKQMEYIRLRDEGMKPSDAHKAVYKAKVAEEVTGGIIGGSISGISIDDEGNLTLDPEEFLLGFLGGAAIASGAKSLGK